MAWRLAKSLFVLLSQVNQQFPQRSKSSDGTIGDPAHAARKSDHNPDADGVVKALDITHDPVHGLDSEKLAQFLWKRRDPRIQYIISNKKIANFDVEDGKWRPYNGANSHNHHVHISVRKKNCDDTSLWDLSMAAVGQIDVPVKPYVAPPPLTKIGDRSNSVVEIQKILEITPDGIFGKRTKTAVQQFQKAHGLVDDGIVGPATWAKLKEKK